MIDLRITTIEIIEKISEQGMSFKKATLRVFTLARLKHIKTGFPLDSFEGFYRSYRTYKSLYKKQKGINTSFIDKNLQAKNLQIIEKPTY